MTKCEQLGEWLDDWSDKLKSLEEEDSPIELMDMGLFEKVIGHLTKLSQISMFQFKRTDALDLDE